MTAQITGLPDPSRVKGLHGTIRLVSKTTCKPSLIALLSESSQVAHWSTVSFDFIGYSESDSKFEFKIL